MSSNKGHFEPALAPVGVNQVDAPRGIARLIASQAAHLEDLSRLHIDHEEEPEVQKTRSRSAFVADAQKYVRECAQRGVDWTALEEELTAGFESAGIELTTAEWQALVEAWVVAGPQEQAA